MRNNSISLWKCGYLKKLTNPARCIVGNKILLLYTFVTVKKKKKILTEWSCYRGLPWDIGTKVQFQNLLSKDAHELKRKYELFPFDFFHCMQFHFLLLHGSVLVKGSHIENNGKQRTRLLGDLPFIKTSSRKYHFFYFPFCCRGKFLAICFWWCCFIVDRNELKYFLKRLSQSTFIRVHRIMYISCSLTHNYLKQKTRKKKLSVLVS